MAIKTHLIRLKCDVDLYFGVTFWDMMCVKLYIIPYTVVQYC